MRTAAIMLSASVGLAAATAAAPPGAAPDAAGHASGVAASAPATAANPPATANALATAANPPATAANAQATAANAPATASAPPAASCADRSLFGLVRAGRHGRELARIGRRTLRPRPSPRIRLPAGVYGWSWDFSPACDAAAFAGRRGRIFLLDLDRGRRMGTVRIGGSAATGQIAWPQPDRLVALSGDYRSPRVVTVSIPDGRIVATHRLPKGGHTSETTSLGLVILSTPNNRIGSAILTLATPDGGMRRVPLRRIRAGYDSGRRGSLLGRQLTPAVAVDEAGGRVYVIAANEPVVADVDLTSGAVAYHTLRGGGDPAPRPTAAKGLAYGAFRSARWVGDATIAVSGEVTRMRRDWRRAQRRGQSPVRIDPYGLRLIRVDRWRVTTLHPLLRWFTLAGDALLGMDSVPAGQDGSKATGLLAWTTDGSRRFTRFRGERGWIWGASWPYAYVRAVGPRRTHVVDVRTGRTVSKSRERRPPLLLVR